MCHMGLRDHMSVTCEHMSVTCEHMSVTWESTCVSHVRAHECHMGEHMCVKWESMCVSLGGYDGIFYTLRAVHTRPSFVTTEHFDITLPLLILWQYPYLTSLYICTTPL